MKNLNKRGSKKINVIVPVDSFFFFKLKSQDRPFLASPANPIESHLRVKSRWVTLALRVLGLRSTNISKSVIQASRLLVILLTVPAYAIPLQTSYFKLESMFTTITSTGQLNHYGVESLLWSQYPCVEWLPVLYPEASLTYTTKFGTLSMSLTHWPSHHASLTTWIPGTDNIRSARDAFPLAGTSIYRGIPLYRIQVSTPPLNIYWAAIFFLHSRHNHLQTINFLDDSTFDD